ncbi:predicted protein [Postia placenta Mad-698-R]|uniref:Uncharacterized protein n=1 Tax=Postia placenta MAD-698-R-SB12 TaxID=670580 RepID=A0A1X6NHH6_9APHY|nr:hypothetical protein POSPLADRAFT_1043167 [Postia placenta MAD-698-R-SB12]EED84801.1 predicted protein [Postia placenta Mad-698-R]OSX68002.1 hypothetical protein POSPLADRAFT_1043167 [Postia placenta MAD-698-R-SB12]
MFERGRRIKYEILHRWLMSRPERELQLSGCPLAHYRQAVYQTLHWTTPPRSSRSATNELNNIDLGRSAIPMGTSNSARLTFGSDSTHKSRKRIDFFDIMFAEMSLRHFGKDSMQLVQIRQYRDHRLVRHLVVLDEARATSAVAKIPPRGISTNQAGAEVGTSEVKYCCQAALPDASHNDTVTRDMMVHCPQAVKNQAALTKESFPSPSEPILSLLAALALAIRLAPLAMLIFALPEAIPDASTLFLLTRGSPSTLSAATLFVPAPPTDVEP